MYLLSNGTPFFLELLVLHHELSISAMYQWNSSPITINKTNGGTIKTNSRAIQNAPNIEYKGIEVGVQGLDFLTMPVGVNALSNVVLNQNKSIESEFFILRTSEIRTTFETYWKILNNEIKFSFDAANMLQAYNPAFYCAFNHLGFSFLNENTRINQIFQKIIEGYSNGETLTHPSVPSARWLKNTSKIIFNDDPLDSNFLITNKINKDKEAVRRNAYKRLLGADLSHGSNQNYDYAKSNINNDGFFKVFEDFLRLSWTGITEINNLVGVNNTEPHRIKALADDLKHMLLSRRTVENSLVNYEWLDLSDIEFNAHISTMWQLHAISYNSEIVKELSCEGSSTFDRLQKIGNKVGINCHSKSAAFIEMAAPFGMFLRSLELDMIDDGYIAAMLMPQSAPHKHITTLINLYQTTTGVNIKQRSLI